MRTSDRRLDSSSRPAATSCRFAAAPASSTRATSSTTPPTPAVRWSMRTATSSTTPACADPSATTWYCPTEQQITSYQGVSISTICGESIAQAAPQISALKAQFQAASSTGGPNPGYIGTGGGLAVHRHLRRTVPDSVFHPIQRRRAGGDSQGNPDQRRLRA